MNAENPSATPNPNLPPLVDGPRRKMLVEIEVSENFENRLDNQWEVEREIHADRWQWHWKDESLLALLERALPYIQEAGTIQGYGFYRPQNPNDFFPDAESCSPAELAAHKAACEAWDKGEYKRDPNQESGWVGNAHVLKAPWGIGSYQEVNPEAQSLMDAINAMLAERARNRATEETK